MEPTGRGVPGERREENSAVKTILELFHRQGDSRYGGEAVTQREHALQAATFAERQGADSALITAALLHDIGHLLHDLPEDAPERDIDDVHEQRAADWLARYFDASVLDPVRLHVAAKRFLCTAEPGYLERLSAPSLRSLRLQGGPMTDAEAAQFAGEPHFGAALRLRRWDEAAKVVGMKTPTLEHFADYVQRALREHGAPCR
jgi:phosphonate degradation associated HDIG domain protein